MFNDCLAAAQLFGKPCIAQYICIYGIKLVEALDRGMESSHGRPCIKYQLNRVCLRSGH